jgi:prolyl-tRNA editing enzyme YbaK/EbsC (Cys-tRNA(Pro) deacylase)
MAKIRYLQRTHDSIPGDVKAVDDRCAKVLVLLGKAEYCTVCVPMAKRISEKRRMANVESFPEKTGK